MKIKKKVIDFYEKNKEPLSITFMALLLLLNTYFCIRSTIKENYFLACFSFVAVIFGIWGLFMKANTSLIKKGELIAEREYEIKRLDLLQRILVLQTDKRDLMRDKIRLELEIASLYSHNIRLDEEPDEEGYPEEINTENSSLEQQLLDERTTFTGEILRVGNRGFGITGLARIFSDHSIIREDMRQVFESRLLSDFPKQEEKMLLENLPKSVPPEVTKNYDEDSEW